MSTNGFMPDPKEVIRISGKILGHLNGERGVNAIPALLYATVTVCRDAKIPLPDLKEMITKVYEEVPS